MQLIDFHHWIAINIDALTNLTSLVKLIPGLLYTVNSYPV